MKKKIRRKNPRSAFDRNAEKMRKKYPLNESGYFGERGRNERVIYHKNHIKTSKDFYKRISRNGKESRLDNGHGVKSTMWDRSFVIYRKRTKTADSPAVELRGIKKGKVKNQKIHFIRRNKDGK